MLPSISNGSYLVNCKRNKIAVMLLAIFMLAMFTGLALFTNAAYITDNGDTKFVFAKTEDVNTILNENGYTIGEFDEVIVSEQSSQIKRIEIIRAVKATVICGEKTADVMTTSSNVAELLNEIGFAAGEEDEISVPLTASVTDGMTVKIVPALKVKVKADGSEKTVSIKSGTVADALAKAEITLDADDKVTPAASDALKNGLEIVVNRIEVKEVKATEEIPFATTTVNSADLKKGEQKVTVAGVKGSKEVTKKVTYSDGKEISSEVASETVTKAPVNEVVTVGTATVSTSASKIVPTASPSSIGSKVISPAPASVKLDANGLPVNYTKVITGKTSAYTSAPTAHVSCGQVANIGLVAVNPNIIPYGTEMYIVAADGTVYGYAVAADTGGALMRGKVLVDLYMGANNDAVCYQWGIRNATIYILN